MQTDFIEDGYSEEGYLKEYEGFHGEVKFTLRPMLHSERAAFALAVSRAPEKESALIDVLLEKHITDWSYDREAKKENFAKMRPLLKVRLWNIVQGLAISDIREDVKEEAPDVDALLAEVEEDKEEADAGN
tara:strand:+ start:84 stop:476 length:393 start_codon:yes stop_codon:yes gene_type:complete